MKLWRCLRSNSPRGQRWLGANSGGAARAAGFALLVLATAASCSSNNGAPVAPIRGLGAPSPVATSSLMPTPAPTGSPTATPTGSPTSTPSATPSPAPSPTTVAACIPASSVYVADLGSNDISVFAPIPSGGGTLTGAPLATITGSNTGFAGPADVVVQANGEIDVANTNGGTGGSIPVFAASPCGTVNEAPLGTITGSNTGLGFPQRVALDASGKIYVANSSSGGTGNITVYAANPIGTLNEAPLATIAGSNTGIALPYGLAVDVSGKIYVANFNNNSVTVYPANPSGTVNEAPLATISGANTGLARPTGLALDAANRIYVTNNGTFPNSSVTVYPANPSGTLNEAPLATIAGSNTSLTNSYGLSVDASGKVYVTNAGSGASSNPNAILVYPAIPSGGGTLNESPFATINLGSSGLSGPIGVTVH